jgi:hypothetical protein
LCQRNALQGQKPQARSSDRASHHRFLPFSFVPAGFSRAKVCGEAETGVNYQLLIIEKVRKTAQNTG